MEPARVYGTGEKVILSVEDDHAAYLLLQLGFDEVGGDFRLYRVEDGAQALASSTIQACTSTCQSLIWCC
jgi:sirohydrochlorin ferrochelatase